MLKNVKSSKKLMKVLHKFNRYDKREKAFIAYLFVLVFCLVFFPVIKITSLRGAGGSGIRIWNSDFFKTTLIILISLAVLLGRNLSFKFKNMFLTYFGSRENDSLVNFLFLFIITTAFFAITDTIRITSSVTSRVVVSAGGKFIQILLLVGVVMTLISVIKTSKETGKKTKIINMIDEEQTKTEAIKNDIKKGLFDK